MAGNHPNTDMSYTSFGLQDSQEIDRANHPNFAIQEYFALDEWLDEDDPASMVSGSTQYPLYPANEIDDSGGSSSQPEGPSRSKQVIIKLSELLCLMISL